MNRYHESWILTFVIGAIGAMGFGWHLGSGEPQKKQRSVYDWMQAADFASPLEESRTQGKTHLLNNLDREFRNQSFLMEG